LIAGLLPGILIGSSTLHALAYLGNFGSWLGDSPAILVIAHMCRFGMVPAVAGCLLGRMIDADERSLRRLEGAESPAGFIGALSAGQWGIIAAAALLAGAMSLHEIEAAVIVSPPGDSLARLILGYLHQSRDEDLSAATLWMIALSGLAAAGVAWGLRRAVRGVRPRAIG
jgi:ABC-type spermidine/putrescine transport system permease subunit II